jgi:hypothetical protein
MISSIKIQKINISSTKKQKIKNDSLVVSKNIIPTFCPEYQAIWNYMTTKPPARVAHKQNIFVQSLISDGLWSKFDVFYLFANSTNDNQEAQINWISPGTNDCSLINNPLFLEYCGFRGDGMKSFIRTNYNPFNEGVQYLLNSCSMGGYVNVLSSNISNHLMGSYPGKLYLAPHYNNTLYRGTLNSNLNYSNIGAITTPQMVAIVRPDSLTITRYKDIIGVDEAINSTSIYDGYINILMGANGYWDNSEISMAWAGGAITPTDMINLVNAWNNYKNYINTLITIDYRCDTTLITADNSLITADQL